VLLLRVVWEEVALVGHWVILSHTALAKQRLLFFFRKGDKIMLDKFLWL
jgi:hypothetical protein